MSAVVIDIDGTLLETEVIDEEIEKLGLTGDDALAYFYANCNRPNLKAKEGVVLLAKRMAEKEDVIFLTARNEHNRKATIKKLDSIFDCKFYMLSMRDNDDLREPFEVKRDKLKSLMEHFDISLFVDDNQLNCEMAKELGITTLKVV